MAMATHIRGNGNGTTTDCSWCIFCPSSPPPNLLSGTNIPNCQITRQSVCSRRDGPQRQGQQPAIIRCELKPLYFLQVVPRRLSFRVAMSNKVTVVEFSPTNARHVSWCAKADSETFVRCKTVWCELKSVTIKLPPHSSRASSRPSPLNDSGPPVRKRLPHAHPRKPGSRDSAIPNRAGPAGLAGAYADSAAFGRNPSYSPPVPVGPTACRNRRRCGARPGPGPRPVGFLPRPVPVAPSVSNDLTAISFSLLCS